jgi:hypothetical protein
LFEIFDYDEFEKSDIKVNVVLEKKYYARINFRASGTVNVPCDLTSEDFDLPISGDEHCSFGDQFNNDNEELLILPLVSLRSILHSTYMK